MTGSCPTSTSAMPITPCCHSGATGHEPVREFDLFLSHNHNDSVRVETLARLLAEKHGLRVWLDKWECEPGKLKTQCEKGIRNSRFTVVVGSKAAMKSKWVQWEIDKHKVAGAQLRVVFRKQQQPPDGSVELVVGRDLRRRALRIQHSGARIGNVAVDRAFLLGEAFHGLHQVGNQVAAPFASARPPRTMPPSHPGLWPPSGCGRSRSCRIPSAQPAPALPPLPM